ncbi:MULTISPECIES: demethoxyubiquinone hydroxylase family protein [unclassified Candidatus Frackibacter]|uniref:demethoxyubiquinone hydroxylase family protein n=1 Tax=unclassified Candidatus Frackibacter TaxID=2648818 RepID=UPI000794B19E|nr:MULTISPECIES: ferritin-like domain-containing protein [unclassified Candidatus Frackibacter]KXS42151.1 MAG: bacterioferritin (cytochrome b1) [Candidatus Frackibacter sp. T328-2]SDC61355.1 bacterioferritin [Candidatus Frackibacter sp. WG11]SEM75181.1 bacterioferritin [Candidatus Frackibacter sp. WG12]SFL87051.1 bacterioferritin [Candidatus Frackibacter sp. WG13]
MNKKLLIAYLNWFYTLELEQVTLYKEQARASNDDYIKEVLKHLAAIEQRHVENISNSLKRLGTNPSKVGEIIGPIFGKPFSELTTMFGTVNLFRVNILLETRATRDYQNLIERVDDKELLNVLIENSIEEDLHRSWFIEQKRQLNKQKQSRKN